MIEKQRVPDIYIIGAQKYGTTTLYDWLSQHPQIYGHPLAKDYPYFSNDNSFHGGTDQFYSFVKNIPDNCLSLGGDANAMYSISAIERMQRIIPSAKLIAILRNPIDRAYSAYMHAIERAMETRDFEEAINDELCGFYYDPLDRLRRDYLQHGLYAKQIKNLLHYFPKDQIKIIIFEELREKPHNILKNVFKFIGVNNDFIPNMIIHNETQGGYRSKWLARLTYAHQSTQTIRNVIKTLVPFHIRTTFRKKLIAFNRVKAVKPSFPANLRPILQEYYSNEITTLECLLNKEIIAWHTG